MATKRRATKTTRKPAKARGPGEITAPRGKRISSIHQAYGRTIILTTHEKSGHVDAYVVGKKNGKLLLIVDGSASRGTALGETRTGRTGKHAITSTAMALQHASHFLNNFPVGDES